MKISNLLRSLDVKIKDAAALFGRINDNFDVIKRILQNQVSLGDNIKCDIITGQFDSGVPRACGLKNLKIARGAIVLGSEHPCIATPLTAMSGDQAAVTLFFAGLRRNVTATILLFDEGFSGTSYGSLLATSTFPGIVKPDGSTTSISADGTISAAGGAPGYWPELGVWVSSTAPASPKTYAQWVADGHTGYWAWIRI